MIMIKNLRHGGKEVNLNINELEITISTRKSALLNPGEVSSWTTKNYIQIK